MKSSDVIPELKQIVGALLFVSRKPLTVSDVRRALMTVGESGDGPAREFATLERKDVEEALEALRRDVDRATLGFSVHEVANGYRLENDAGCGPWVRALLEKGKPHRLSKPALETLAVIAYRQPATRGEIENVRGVAVDQIIRNLLEMQLIRVAGRSDLPGRPWLFGTTPKFLEHFGLKSLKDLPGVDELKKLDAMKAAADDASAVTEEMQEELALEEGKDEGGDEDEEQRIDLSDE